MIDVIIGGAIVCSSLGITWTIQKRANRFSRVAKKMDTSIDEFVQMHDLGDIDYELQSPSDIINLKNRYDKTSGVRFLGDKNGKGYDFIEFDVNADYISPPHRHEKSTEFIYMVSGEIEVSQCANALSDCKHCELDCIFGGGNFDVKPLLPGDTIMIQPKRYHSISANEKSKYIVIAMPTIFKRLR